ncbi:MAG TPA: hypothetical protein VK588_13390 [Chitinophagaceae bacterium]|nr:hypothetical protein [Chitinophagaceae bacterium]
MDITTLYNGVIESLRAKGFNENAEALERQLAGAATGGEGLSATAGYLLQLKKSQSRAYYSSAAAIDQYLALAYKS